MAGSNSNTGRVENNFGGNENNKANAQENVRNSVQKKRLSWGKSKVLEFYKDPNDHKEEQPKSPLHTQLKNYSKEPERQVSCRDRRFRASPTSKG